MSWRIGGYGSWPGSGNTGGSNNWGRRFRSKRIVSCCSTNSTTATILPYFDFNTRRDTDYIAPRMTGHKPYEESSTDAMRVPPT